MGARAIANWSRQLDPLLSQWPRAVSRLSESLFRFRSAGLAITVAVAPKALIPDNSPRAREMPTLTFYWNAMHYRLPAFRALRTAPMSLIVVLGCAHNAPGRESTPAHDSFTVLSKALGEARAINIYTPPQYRAAPWGTEEPLPVLYMPDGGLDEDFPHVVSTVDSLIARGQIRPVIVVGVPNTQRRRDLTGPTLVATDSMIAPRVGGSTAFRRFLREELVPEVERRYRTTRERAIVGESLAGLFVVETFLEEPGLFAHYIALDPSVWWNAGALVDSARTSLGAFDVAPRTLYLASSREANIIVGTARLAALLRTTSPPGLRWTYEARPDLTHGTIFRALEPAALLGAFRSR